jgi:hypothetical protein
MNMQQAFDVVWKKFVVENQGPCMSFDMVSNGTAPAYISEDRVDPVGALLQLQNPKLLEGLKNSTGDVWTHPEISEALGLPTRFLARLQGCHDEAVEDEVEDTPSRFSVLVRENLEKLGAQYSLCTPNQDHGLDTARK